MVVVEAGIRCGLSVAGIRPSFCCVRPLARRRWWHKKISASAEGSPWRRCSSSMHAQYWRCRLSTVVIVGLAGGPSAELSTECSMMRAKGACSLFASRPGIARKTKRECAGARTANLVELWWRVQLPCRLFRLPQAHQGWCDLVHIAGLRGLRERALLATSTTVVLLW